jgi:hypothetical protein
VGGIALSHTVSQFKRAQNGAAMFARSPCDQNPAKERQKVIKIYQEYVETIIVQKVTVKAEGFLIVSYSMIPHLPGEGC